MSSSVTATASSGVETARDTMRAAAHDLAKATTRDTKAQGVDNTDVRGGGAQSHVRQEERTPAHVEDKMIELMRAKHAAKANLKVIKMEDRMVGHLVDKRA